MREFRDYLKYAHKYVSLAEDKARSREDIEWLLIPATILAWSAIESFVNNRCDDLNSVPSGMFELHERAFLQERNLRFVDKGESIGNFVLEGNNYQTLENKIFFLLRKIGSPDASTIKGGELWERFKAFKEVRDSFAHPRRGKETVLNIKEVNDYIDTAQEIIQEISERIWKTRMVI